MEHDFEFDPTCGFSKDELLEIQPPDNEPEDFAAFWRDAFEETASQPLNIETKKLWSPNPEIGVYEVYFDSIEAQRIGAWITIPKNPVGGVVCGHGYGGRAWFDTYWAENGFAAIYVCIRGFNLSSCLEIPWKSSQHVIHNIDSKDKYVLKGATADTWRAVDMLTEMCPSVLKNLNYDGSSFGGGMGALALAWDKRFKAGHLGVPTFGNHPIRLKFESTGSGESVRQYSKTHPQVMDVLKYYDAATAAKYIKIPMLCSPALFDPSVIPPGQFAVTNALKNSETVILPAGHYNFEGEKELYGKLMNKRLTLFAAIP